jgi:FG-GAP-like repeat
MAWSMALVAGLLSAVAFAQNPVPQIVGPVQPMAVAPGSGAFTLTVYGANFVPGAVVNWNGQPRSTTFVSARELQAQILATDVTVSTAGVITATNPGPGGGNSSSSYAQVEVHTPTTGIVPNRPTVYPVDPATIVPANLNGNGILDLMGFAVDGAALFLGNGTGTFQLQSTGGPLSLGSGAISYGDFNGDGLEDVAYVSGNYNNGPPWPLAVMLNNGDGTYRLGSTVGGSTYFDFAYAAAVGDFNGDGKLDIATIDGSFNVYLGNGDGTFQQGVSLAMTGGAIIAGDFNGDGKLDLAVWSGNQKAFVIALLVGNGDGTFQKPRTITFNDGFCGFQGGLEADDFNGDGHLDLAFCNKDQVGILLGNGDGTFQKPVFYAAGYDGAFTFATGDFNSDGKTDLAISHYTFDEQFWTLLGNGDGTFQPKQVMKHLPGACVGELGIEVGDFNSDGLLDFVLGLNDPCVYLQHRQ